MPDCVPARFLNLSVNFITHYMNNLLQKSVNSSRRGRLVRFNSVIIIFIVLSVSCQPRTVTRINPDTQIDLSGRWNDSDSRLVADKMIHDLFDSERFKVYANENGKKPTIVVGLIKNKTSEHIDAA